MSRANQQSLCILSAMKAGLVTVHQEQESLSPQFMADILECDGLLTTAIKEWDEDPKDNGKALHMLSEWVDSLEKSGLESESNITVMISMSQQACQDLLGKVRNKKKIALLDTALEVLDRLGSHLHDGMSDKALIPKFELADVLLGKLYDVTGFET